MTPTARSLEFLRSLGYTAEVVEVQLRHALRARDLFGFVDIVALRGPDTLAVQTTTAGNMAARVAKVRASPLLEVVLAAGWTVVVHGWRPNGTLRQEVVT